MNNYPTTSLWNTPTVNTFNFPLNVLPPFGSSFPVFIPFPKIQGVIDELERNIQAPRAMNLASTLATISTVLHGLVDVRTPVGTHSAVSLFLVVIADSGERKSAVEKKLDGEIRAYEKRIQEIAARRNAGKGCRGKSVIEKQFVQIDQKIDTQKATDYLNESIDECIESMGNLGEGENGGEARDFTLNYKDVTPEGLPYLMNKNFKYVALRLTEGFDLFSDRSAVKSFSKNNSFWSSEPVTIHRKSGENIVLFDARLTLLAMSQYAVFCKFMDGHGVLARSSGFLPRSLYCRPMSTQGSRFISGFSPSWDMLNDFNRVVRKFLDLNYEILYDQDREKKIVDFSIDARERWIQVANAIEAQICVGGRFEGMGDHASKLADNIARVAALLECFENGIDSKISLSTLECSIAICFWFSDEFLRDFRGYPQEVVDSMELDTWLEEIRFSGRRYVTRKYLLQCSPSKMRKKARLDPALSVLEKNIRVRQIRVERTMCVDLLPWNSPEPERASVEVSW